MTCAAAPTSATCRSTVDRRERTRQSHAIARDLRPQLAAAGRRHAASVKLVEVPPGPPVLAPIVAEVYGPDYARSRAIGRALEQVFAATPGIVDVDSSVEAEARREVLVVDRERAARLGIAQSAITATLAGGLGGLDASHVIDDGSRHPRPIRLRLPAAERGGLDALLALEVRAGDGARVPLSEVVRVEHAGWDGAILHKDLRPVVYVTGDEAGAFDSPLYGMFDLVGRIDGARVAGETLDQAFIRAPDSMATFAIKWDGEWQITYETFRDMGLAYAGGIVLIYLLVVAWFRDYRVPLVSRADPADRDRRDVGDAVLGAPFTATR